MSARVKAGIIGSAAFCLLLALVSALSSHGPTVPRDLSLDTIAKRVAARAWYFGLGRCAAHVRTAVEGQPQFWSRDMRVVKCRPLEGTAGECLIEALGGDGLRHTELAPVECGMPMVGVLTRDEAIEVGKIR